MASVNRPNTGTLGRPICLRANHFALDFPTDGHLFHYHVEMQTLAFRLPPRDVSGSPGQPEVIVLDMHVPKDTRRRAIAQLVTECKGLFRGQLPVFDGESDLYSSVELAIPNPAAAKRGVERKVEMDVKLPQEGPHRRTTLRVAIRACNPMRIAWSALRDAMEERGTPLPVHVIACINTVLREAALSVDQNIAVGRSYFAHTPDAVSLGEGRITWPGCCASARPCQSTMSVNLDVAHGVFYENLSLLDLMMTILHVRPPLRSLTEQQRCQLMAELKGLQVSTSAEGKMPKRFYILAKLSREKAEKCAFDVSGETVLVADYFREKYNYYLKYPELPMVETTTKCLLPIELCEVVDGQKVKRRLTEQQTATMIRACAKPAPVRKQQIEDLRKHAVGYDDSAHMAQFGINVAKDMQAVTGRILPVPTIGQRGGKTLNVNESMGTWDTRNTQFAIPMPLQAWSVVVPHGFRGTRMLDDFLDKFVELGTARGMRIEQPYPYSATSDHPDFVRIIGDIGTHFEQKEQDVQLVMILAEHRGLYADIKRAGDVRWGVPTQVVLLPTLETMQRGSTQRGNMLAQYAGNILLKVNAKIGGINNTNYTLDKCPPNSPLYSRLHYFVDKLTIVFGADVSHPGAGEEGKPSIAAVMASYDPSFTRYIQRVGAQCKVNPNSAKKSATQEIITDLAAMVRELLKEFADRAQAEPQQIVFYRDGVSEGQYKEVIEREVKAIKQACRELVPDGTYNPPITYIVVGKRHHVRLFYANEREATTKSGNVPPGTVVDTGITHVKDFDFYMVNHGGIQGTSRPGHYIVLHDDSKLSADQIELFSYYLSYVYARCNRSVSLPTPVYYAHLAAKRARLYLTEVDVEKTSEISSGKPPQMPDLEAINAQIRINPHLEGLFFA